MRLSLSSSLPPHLTAIFTQTKLVIPRPKRDRVGRGPTAKPSPIVTIFILLHGTVIIVMTSSSSRCEKNPKESGMKEEGRKGQ